MALRLMLLDSRALSDPPRRGIGPPRTSARTVYSPPEPRPSRPSSRCGHQADGRIAGATARSDAVRPAGRARRPCGRQIAPPPRYVAVLSVPWDWHRSICVRGTRRLFRLLWLAAGRSSPGALAGRGSPAVHGVSYSRWQISFLYFSYIAMSRTATDFPVNYTRRTP